MRKQTQFGECFEKIKRVTKQTYFIVGRGSERSKTKREIRHMQVLKSHFFADFAVNILWMELFTTKLPTMINMSFFVGLTKKHPIITMLPLKIHNGE
jgi:hypothetical protein